MFGKGRLIKVVNTLIVTLLGYDPVILTNTHYSTTLAMTKEQNMSIMASSSLIFLCDPSYPGNRRPFL